MTMAAVEVKDPGIPHLESAVRTVDMLLDTHPTAPFQLQTVDLECANTAVADRVAEAQ